MGFRGVAGSEREGGFGDGYLGHLIRMGDEWENVVLLVFN